MRVTEEIAEEIYQVYSSGKRGIVLEMEQVLVWREIVSYLAERYFSDKAVVEVHYGKRQDNSFAPCFYQRCGKTLRLMAAADLENVTANSYLALGLEKMDEKKGLGMLLLESFSCCDSRSKEKAEIALLQLLTQQPAKEQAPLLLIMLDDIQKLSPYLFPYVHVIRGRKPGAEELLEEVQEVLKKLALPVESSISGAFEREMVSYLQGFWRHEVSYLFQRALRRYGQEAFDEDKRRVLETIREEKVKLLGQQGLLEWKSVKKTDMANMEVLSNYLKDSGRIMANLQEAVAEGNDVPKGILIMGLPGTGKSLFAQYAAAELKLPLIRLDMGRMMGSHVGDSERNLREAQRQAEEMAPCILWMDEIEKGFSGTGKGGREEGAGYLQRMLGGFLTWLQEKSSSCYVIATANSIQNLPAEFFRKGRFDECFYTFMPYEQELREILRVHLSKPERVHVMTKETEQAVDMLVQIATGSCRFMTGADVSALVSHTFRRLYLNYHECEEEEEEQERPNKKDYDKEHIGEVLLEEFKKIRVFSETNAVTIAEYYRGLRKNNFVRASKKGQNTNYDQTLDAFVLNTLKQEKQSQLPTT
ncbi:MAG: AAA family ATPase [bacterium]|nr:AAA family ATPase [bacterium]